MPRYCNPFVRPFVSLCSRATGEDEVVVPLMIRIPLVTLEAVIKNVVHTQSASITELVQVRQARGKLRLRAKFGMPASSKFGSHDLRGAADPGFRLRYSLSSGAESWDRHLHEFSLLWLLQDQELPARFRDG
jgi:hypothetical protein